MTGVPDEWPSRRRKPQAQNPAYRPTGAFSVIPESSQVRLMRKSGACTEFQKYQAKGRLPLPKTVRERLGSKFVRLISDETGVRIEPVRDVAGSLKRYAKNYVSI